MIMTTKNYNWFGIVAVLFFLPFYSPDVSKDWAFRKEIEGIKIYTREATGSNIKELKFTTIINSSMTNSIALLLDVDNYDRWVYKCAESTILEEIDELQSYCYYNIDFPWPMSDRDMIIYSTITQDPVTKTVVSNSYGRPNYLPEKEGLVRIADHFNQWQFKPLSSGQIQVTYLLKSDPGGSIPSWMINLAIDQGPLKSMQGFLQQLHDPKYKNARLPEIENF
jgi:ribosome-associated toxin RatA of RatAB toxin-antitoxin module